MADITKYDDLQKLKLELNRQLRQVRLDIKTFEAQMIQEMQNKNQPLLSVQVRSVPSIVRLSTRTRRVQLTETDLRRQLQVCLQDQFGSQVQKASIEEFAATMSRRIWSERRVKNDQKISVKAVQL
jgi:hypothetical protein